MLISSESTSLGSDHTQLRIPFTVETSSRMILFTAVATHQSWEVEVKEIDDIEVLSMSQIYMYSVYLLNRVQLKI